MTVSYLPIYLPIAARAWIVRQGVKQRRRRSRGSREARWPKAVLTLDTETTTDPTQRLLFGSYRYSRWTKRGMLRCVEEGLFYADDLPERDPAGWAILQRYVRMHQADVAPGMPRTLRLRSRRAFLKEVFWPAAYEAQALVVGFNLPFDLSRLAVTCGAARGLFRGGFSFVLDEYWDRGTEEWRENGYRPRLGIKHHDRKRAFIGFVRPPKADREPDRVDKQIGAGEGQAVFRGRLLDLKTLTFALTGQNHSLASACEAYGVEHGKIAAAQHGVITDDYLGYNRRDVLATQELLERVREEFDRHPIDLDPCKAFSPASVAKAYLRAMRVRPPGQQFEDLPAERLGQTTVAFFGGRAECRIRRTIVPVVYCDFLSMYPTVNSLMGLWSLLTAERLQVVDATATVRQLLARFTRDRGFDPATWRDLTFFANVLPAGDILPVRARYDPATDGFSIGVNPCTSETPLWYAGPDLAASVVLTGKVPNILQAFRLVPVGRQPGVRPVRLRGAIPVDPRRADLFRAMIEARKGLPHVPGLTEEERHRLDRFLKVLANSGSYGIFAEMNRQDLPAGRRADVTVYGLNGPFPVHTKAPEEPGAYCFPPLAALITAAARFMLALLEQCVTDLGGTYAFCDTDSMAIVATPTGGLVPCPGGPYTAADGAPAIRALSWAEVDTIVTRFTALNPYDRTVVPGSILKVEDENFQNSTRQPLYVYAISAKRYALFHLAPTGTPILRKWSEHGLGHLLPPVRSR